MIKLLLTTIFCINLFASQLELSGTVISDNEKIITSRNMGFIKEVYVNEGSSVKKGDILYEIDSSNIDSNKKEIELNLQIQENQLQNIELNYGRYKRLQAQDLVSKYEVEQLELNMQNLKNMINITKAKQKELNAQYDYLKIKAPNDGLIIKKMVKAGEMAMPSVPAFILTDLSKLLIKADISEANLNDLKINQEVDIEISSQNLKTKGKIVAIIPNVVGMTHSFIIKISFDKESFNANPNVPTSVGNTAGSLSKCLLYSFKPTFKFTSKPPSCVSFISIIATPGKLSASCAVKFTIIGEVLYNSFLGNSSSS